MSFERDTAPEGRRDPPDIPFVDAKLELAAIVESSYDAIIGKTTEGIIRAWNPAAERLYGYTPEEAIGWPITLIIPRERAGEEREILARIARGERVEPFVTERVHKDGTRLRISLTVSPIRTAAGEIVGASAIGRDITEQARLHEAATRLAAIVDSSDDAIIAKSTDGTITSWNKAAERLYGYTAAQAVGKSISLIFPPELAGQEGEILAKVVRGEPLDHYETQRMRKDGNRVDVSLTISPVRGIDGEIMGASVIARDVTERREAEAARRDAHATQRFRASFADAPVGMAVCDLAPGSFGRILEVNPALLRIVALAEQEVLGLGLPELLHPEARATFAERAGEVAAGALRSFEQEVRLTAAGAQPLWASVTLSLLHDQAGAPLQLLALVQDVSERKRIEGQLQHLADHDALTGLCNRRRFELELERHLAAGQRYDARPAVIVFDVDDFKLTNDTLGHKAADEVLITIARLLAERARATDVVARLGGDQFGVLLPDSSPQDASVFAADVLEAIRTDDLAAAPSARRTTATAGIAVADPETPVLGAELLVAADLALYEAKQAGRDRVAVYSEAFRARVQARQTWLDRIRDALDGDGFVLQAQPIVALGVLGAPPRYELLIRMKGEGDDLIAPASFLGAAERFGLIADIDRWVVGQAIALLTEHHAAGSDLCLEVNLSGRSVTDPELAAMVERAVAAGGFDPSRLVFEITETAAIENVVEARAFAERIRALGCRFALDDFGAGFGSFYYLKHLPFDFLKIDGEFVKGLATGRTDQLVVRSIVEIARGLGKETIAEFVGDDETVALLRSMGVDHGQGYHLGRPGPLPEPLGSPATPEPAA